MDAADHRWDFYYGGALVARGLNSAAADGLKESIIGYLSKGESGFVKIGGDAGTPGVVDIFITSGIPFHFFSETAPMEYNDPLGPLGPGVMFGR